MSLEETFIDYPTQEYHVDIQFSDEEDGANELDIGGETDEADAHNDSSSTIQSWKSEGADYLYQEMLPGAGTLLQVSKGY